MYLPLPPPPKGHTSLSAMLYALKPCADAIYFPG